MKKQLKYLLIMGIITIAGCTNNKFDTILVIGDSNAAIEHGWVAQFKKIDSSLIIINKAHGSNTIGFNNGNNPLKNEIKNIDKDISEAIKEAKEKTIELILVNLGTNDCKLVFADSLSIVPKNLSILISKIKNFDYGKTPTPKIIIISPPPMGPDSLLKDKYKGGSKRVVSLVPQLKKIAQENNCDFIDIWNPLNAVFSTYAKDGVHMNKEGQAIVAQIIRDYIENI